MTDWRDATAEEIRGDIGEIMKGWDERQAKHAADPMEHGNVPPGYTMVMRPECANFFEKLVFEDWVNYYAVQAFGNCHLWKGGG